MQINKNKRGSMMIDLLVVLGIIALLSTIAIPYLRKYQPNLKLNATARNLTTDLRYAQQLTVTEQTVHVVSFDLINSKYDILRVAMATTTIKTVNLDPEVNFNQIIGLTNNQVIFNYYGGVSQAGQIILTNTNNSMTTINVKPSGYIQLEQ
jgi:Tfp pilus assembly protein FimT